VSSLRLISPVGLYDLEHLKQMEQLEHMHAQCHHPIPKFETQWNIQYDGSNGNQTSDNIGQCVIFEGFLKNFIALYSKGTSILQTTDECSC